MPELTDSDRAFLVELTALTRKYGRTFIGSVELESCEVYAEGSGYGVTFDSQDNYSVLIEWVSPDRRTGWLIKDTFEELIE